VPLVSQLALRLPPEDPALPHYLRALAGFGHPAGAPAVDRGLASETWSARAAAAHAAGRIGLAATAPRLAELLDDENWWVRFRAGEALSHLGPEGQNLLVETARSGPERARMAAVLTLAERSGPE
jgi:HEAT repeat protein